MPISIPCPECKNDIPQPAERCPHCGRPGIFWNVIAASDAAEQVALDSRYVTAMADAVSRGVVHVVQDFESVVSKSGAVIARSEGEVLRLATSTRQLYATYYQQVDSGLKLPDGDEWALVREVADTLLFPQYKKDIRFGALCLDGVGLSNYGTCSITLKEEMISHRASVFEENSVLFTQKHGLGTSNPDLPKGFRSAWSDRGKICIAKLARGIDSTTEPAQYSELLLKQGKTSADDDFIEVHIWGPLSILSISEITVRAPRQRQRMTIIKALRAKLAKHGVPVK
jgi:hypothetical protein